MIEGRSSTARLPGQGAHAPRTNVFVAREDIAVAIDEGDVDGIGHKTRMDRRAAWKRHDERQTVGGNRTPSQHATQAHGKRLRHHKLDRASNPAC